MEGSLIRLDWIGVTRPSEQTEASFAGLGIAQPILTVLAELGYERPTPIQAATVPALLAGRHLVGLAQTGTGKTAAFALPILSRLELTERRTQALVLTPTRELALQVSEAISRYGHHLPACRYCRSTAARAIRCSWPACAGARRWWWAHRAGSSITCRRRRWTCRRCDSWCW